MPPHHRLPTWFAGALIGLAAVMLRWSLGQIIPMGDHVHLLHLGILAAAVVYGVRAGIAASFVCVLGTMLLILPPPGSLYIADPGDRFLPPIFLGVAADIIALAHWLRVARRRAELGSLRALRRLHRAERENVARRRAEAELRESEERYQALVALNPDAVLVQQDERFVYANPAAARLLGAPSPDDLVGVHYERIVHPRYRDIVRGRIGTAASTGNPTPLLEEPIVRLDGTTVDCEVTGGAVMWRRRKAHQVIIRDITERLAANRRMEEMREDLVRSNQELREFGHTVAHGLKEPLRGLANTARVLLEDHGDRFDSAARSLLDTLVQLPEHLIQRVDEFLRYSQIGHMNVRLAPASLRGIVEQVRTMLGPFLAEHHAVIEATGDLPTLDCSEELLEELLSNLVVNGVKYNTSDQKFIRIGYRRPDADSSEGTPGVVTVSDNGIGIAGSHRQAVFEPFRRLHPRRAFGGGTGLGLTVCRRIVERHGGRIWVETGSESARGGSTFCFTLGTETARAAAMAVGRAVPA